jgi:hypothetical protein
MPHADGLFLMGDDRKPIAGPFSSHWAACAAMIRLSIPTFRSTGGDREGDLALERAIKRAEVG